MKTYADLMAELEWLGPAVVMRMIEAGTAKMCLDTTVEVQGYLAEKGFDVGSGHMIEKHYMGHYVPAAYTEDRGWITIDPTYIQFHGYCSFSDAAGDAVRNLFPEKEEHELTDAEFDLVESRAKELFEPVIQYSVNGMLRGAQAFQIAPFPGRYPEHYRRPDAASRRRPFGEPTWENYWARKRRAAKELVEFGGLDPLIYMETSRRRRRTKPYLGGYWAEEVARRTKQEEDSYFEGLRSKPAYMNPPEKYLAGLPPELREQRIRELEAAAAGEYGYDPLPTDIAAQRMGLVKKGRYTKAAEARGIEHRGDFRETAARALAYYGVATSSQNVSKVAKELEKVFKKGLAAWRTGGHRPGASQQAWAYARVASVLTGGKAYFTADSGNVAQFPEGMRKAIEADPSWSGGSRRNPRARRNPRSGVDAKPVILIGLYSRPDLRRDAAVRLLEAGYEDLAYRVAREDNVLHFDMDALPERGDALDHFDRGSAVIAHHLYYDDTEPSRGPGRNFFYNVKNNQIVDLAEAAGIPLFIFGDYPFGARTPDARTPRFGGLRVYLPRAVRARPNRKGRFRRGTDPKANYAEIQQMLRTAPSDWKAQFRSGMSTRAASGQKGGSRDMTVENALKILGITAGGNVSGDRASGRHKVPDEVREAAMKGLRLSYKNNYGAWDFIGIARAIQLATQSGVPDETRRRMKNYFSRHTKDKESSRFGNDANPSRGYMAWLNWGGDPGLDWVSGVARKNPDDTGVPPTSPRARYSRIRSDAGYAELYRDLGAELNKVQTRTWRRQAREVRREIERRLGPGVRLDSEARRQYRNRRYATMPKPERRTPPYMQVVLFDPETGEPTGTFNMAVSEVREKLISLLRDPTTNWESAEVRRQVLDQLRLLSE